MTLLHLVGAVGLVFVVSLGNIAEPLRRVWKRLPGKLGELLPCPQCFGFWAGLGWAIALAFRSRMPAWLQVGFDAIAFAFTVSLLGFLGAALEAWVISLSRQPRRTLMRRRP